MKKKIRILFTGLCYVALLTGCGNISQATKKIELGKNVTVMDLVNCKEGVSASIKNKSALNTMKLGSYDVVFNVKNSDGKTEEKTFTYEVVDTTAPEITTDDKLTIIKGVDFNVQELVAATDLSGDVKIISSAEVDTKTPGEYPITVTAEDASGNKATKDIIVTVIERTETNFRNVVWGDNTQMVSSLETAEPVDSPDVDETFLLYSDTVATVPVEVFYLIDPEYGTYSAGYMNYDYSYAQADKAIADYFTLKESLVKKYGEPNKKSELGYLSSLGTYGSINESMMLGLIYYRAEWTVPETNTIIGLDAYQDNYGYLCRVKYEDTRYEADYSGSF